MEPEKKSSCRKSDYGKVTLEHKLFVIEQVNNGQITYSGPYPPTFE
jgi:hypothetical protein